MTAQVTHTPGRRDRCYAGKNGWQECTECGGRIHDAACATERRPHLDCCTRRHLSMGLSADTAARDPYEFRTAIAKATGAV